MTKGFVGNLELSSLITCLKKIVIPAIIVEMGLDIEKQLTLEFGYSVAIGSALASCFNYLASYHVVWGWKFSKGIVIPLAFLVFVGSFYIYETPFWLIEHRRQTEAKLVLKKMRCAVNVDVIYDEIEEKVLRRTVDSNVREVFHRRSRPSLVITIVAKILVQLLEFSVYTNYGPFLLRSLDYESDEVFLFPVIFSSLSVIVAFIQPLIFMRFGRRRSLIIASFLMLYSLFLSPKTEIIKPTKPTKTEIVEVYKAY
ncbi:sugar transport protein MST8-like [Mercurialis annua]|uniref:sugar transport protein MST8-like n=1 Tax=Mercurialis annua TaxID=3986 RepID=UPI0024AE0221|nr:sugar transport protein MST8-like [Mercurialis annua]